MLFIFFFTCATLNIDWCKISHVTQAKMIGNQLFWLLIKLKIKSRKKRRIALQFHTIIQSQGDFVIETYRQFYRSWNILYNSFQQSAQKSRKCFPNCPWSNVKLGTKFHLIKPKPFQAHKRNIFLFFVKICLICIGNSI